MKKALILAIQFSIQLLTNDAALIWHLILCKQDKFLCTIIMLVCLLLFEIACYVYVYPRKDSSCKYWQLKDQHFSFQCMLHFVKQMAHIVLPLWVTFTQYILYCLMCKFYGTLCWAQQFHMNLPNRVPNKFASLYKHIFQQVLNLS